MWLWVGIEGTTPPFSISSPLRFGPPLVQDLVPSTHTQGLQPHLQGGHCYPLIGALLLFFSLKKFLKIYIYTHTHTHTHIWPRQTTACGILVSWPRIEPAPLALEAWSLNHWTTREVPGTLLFQWGRTSPGMVTHPKEAADSVTKRVLESLAHGSEQQKQASAHTALTELLSPASPAADLQPQTTASAPMLPVSFHNPAAQHASSPLPWHLCGPKVAGGLLSLFPPVL